MSTIKDSEDPVFELSCLETRLDSLIPILESTERAVRLEYLSDLSKQNDKITINTNLRKILDALEEESLRHWNLINFQSKEIEQFEDWKNISWMLKFKKLSKLRYFVCLSLTIYSLLDIGNIETKLRCLKCFIKSYHEFLDIEVYDHCKAMQDYFEKICPFIDGCDMNEKEKQSYESFKIEFLILNMESAILSNDIALAKFYEDKANLTNNYGKLKPEILLNISRVLYNNGLKLFKAENFDDAKYFLEKCYLVLKKMTVGKLEIITREKVKVATLTVLGKCCIKINTKESLLKANKTVKLLQTNDNHKIEAFKLQLEVLEFQGLTSKKEIEDSIMKLIITFSDKDTMSMQLLSILNTYSVKEPTIAKNCLLYIFNNKIDFTNKAYMPTVESYLISLIWMTTSQLKKEIFKEKFRIAQSILEMGDKKVMFDLSDETINSIVVMLWSVGKKLIKDKKYEDAILWFDCCFIRLLKKPGQSFQEMTGKIQRSMLQCCIKTNDKDQYNKILNEMCLKDKNDSISLYYQFVGKLKFDQEENHSESLNILNQLSQTNNMKTINLLALCVVDCNEYKNVNTETLKKAIDQLLNKCFTVGTGQCDDILVVALRSSVYIHGKTFEKVIDKIEDNFKNNNNLKEIVNIIDKSVNQFYEYIKEKNKYEEFFNDIEWFASNCYNFGLQLLTKNILDISGIKLFKDVVKIIDLLKCDQSIDDKVREFYDKVKKWKNKSIIFESFCIRETLKVNDIKLQNNEEWEEIYQINKHNIEELVNPADQELMFQSEILIDECLINRGKWKEINDRVKFINEAGTDINKRGQEIDIIIEILIDKICRYDIVKERNEYDGPQLYCKEEEEIKKLFDLIVLSCSKKYQIRKVFKWVYLITEKKIEDKDYENKILGYVDLIKERLADFEATGNTAKEELLEENGIEWLSSVCWNRGIELILGGSTVGVNGYQNIKTKADCDSDKANSSESIENSSFSKVDEYEEFEESSINKLINVAEASDENPVKKRKLGNSLTCKGSPKKKKAGISGEKWCERGIALSVSENKRVRLRKLLAEILRCHQSQR